MNTCPYAVGTKVECNGFPGTITRICDWSDSMIEVRVPGGVVCVDYHEVKHAAWERIMRDRKHTIARATRRILANRA